MTKKLDKLFKNSKRLDINDNTKIVIMSDCHRGIGDNLDNFIKNQNIYESALMHYYNNDFNYIELGDGDELWEIKNYEDIIEVYLSTFKQIKKFHDHNRFIMIYGNHDISKKSQDFLKKYFYKYYDKTTNQEEPLLEGLTVYESLVLTYKKYDIFLIHGHQVDFLNNELWPISRFLVRYIWKNLEYIGIEAPTKSAKPYEVSNKVEKKLEKWSSSNNTILIAGHTHRAIFPKVGESLYFNDGSCINNDGITCIEIEKGTITLVKWSLMPNQKDIITVKRKVLSKTEPIINYFK